MPISILRLTKPTKLRDIYGVDIIRSGTAKQENEK